MRELLFQVKYEQNTLNSGAIVNKWALMYTYIQSNLLSGDGGDELPSMKIKFRHHMHHIE